MDATFMESYNGFVAARNEFTAAREKMRTQCLDMLKVICNRTDSKEINLDKFKEYCCDCGMGYPTIAYDGGRHPEYASNLYSTVNGFSLVNGKIVFDIEDCDSYSEDRVTTTELTELCDYLIEYEDDGYTLGVADYGDDE